MSNIILGLSALQKIEEGVDILSNAVKSTLGPKGRNVVIKGLNSPIITNDGVTIAKSISIDDPIVNIGAELIKQASIHTNQQAGDGTTTACVLAQSLLKEGVKNITAGANPLSMNKGMQYALKLAVKELEKIAEPIETYTDINKIATISCQDSEIGSLISEAYKIVGYNGVITISDGHKSETELEVVNGIKLDRGYVSTYFSTDTTKEICELDNPKVLIYDGRLDNFNTIIPYIQECIGTNSPLVIISDDYTENLLSALLINKLQAGLQCLPIKAPAYGELRKNILSDLAIIFDTEIINTYSDTINTHIQLGQAKKVISTKYDTTFIQDNINSKVTQRIDDLENKLQECKNDLEKAHINDRLAKLKGKVAVIKVGGISELEMSERKLRIEDALFACKSAICEGIVIGGGSALLKIKQRISKKMKKLSDYEALGAKIFLNALEAPIRQIATNAEIDGGVIINKIIKSSNPNYGYDAQNGKFGDLKILGIVDPAKVLRCALQNAVSVATTILTTNCIAI